MTKNPESDFCKESNLTKKIQAGGRGGVGVSRVSVFSSKESKSEKKSFF